ncbi:MAG: TIGR04086 family membrane protein [Heyndrickxia sp.]
MTKRFLLREGTKIETKKFGTSVLYGVLVIFILITVSSLIFSFILRFTNIQEHSIRLFVTIISFIALFIGGFVCGSKGKEKGWLLGSLTGILYTFIIFLSQYLGYGNVFSFEQTVYHICYILTAMMGGVLGVNMLSGKSKYV